MTSWFRVNKDAWFLCLIFGLEILGFLVLVASAAYMLLVGGLLLKGILPQIQAINLGIQGAVCFALGLATVFTCEHYKYNLDITEGEGGG